MQRVGAPQFLSKDKEPSSPTGRRAIGPEGKKRWYVGAVYGGRKCEGTWHGMMAVPKGERRTWELALLQDTKKEDIIFLSEEEDDDSIMVRVTSCRCDTTSPPQPVAAQRQSCQWWAAAVPVGSGIFGSKTINQRFGSCYLRPVCLGRIK